MAKRNKMIHARFVTSVGVTKNQMTKIFVVTENLQLPQKQILQQRYFGHFIYGSWSTTDVTK